MWEKEFQISLTLDEVKDVHTRQRAHRAVELMQGSKSRSDSMTKGRTEFTYASHF
jgi:ribosomal protein L31E